MSMTKDLTDYIGGIYQDLKEGFKQDPVGATIKSPAISYVVGGLTAIGPKPLNGFKGLLFTDTARQGILCATGLWDAITNVNHTPEERYNEGTLAFGRAVSATAELCLTATTAKALKDLRPVSTALTLAMPVLSDYAIAPVVGGLAGWGFQFMQQDAQQR